MDESKIDAFDLESMEVKYPVAGKTLTLRPMKWGAFRKMSKMTAPIDSDQGEYIFSMLKILFPGAEHDFLTMEFFENEMTMAMSSEIIKKSVEMNGLEKKTGAS